MTEPAPLPNTLKARLSRIHADLGAPAILAIVRDFYSRMNADTMLGFFFAGKNLEQIAGKQTDFILRAMAASGSASYAGKAPAQAHVDLAPILPGHLDRRKIILTQTLRDHGLSPEHIQTWIEFEDSFRSAILGQPGRNTP